MTNYTSGPWLVKQPGEHGKGLRVVHSCGKTASKEIFGAICDISTSRSSDDNFSDATEQANARLIAAAPSLLTALQGLLSLADNENLYEEWKAEFTAAENAIQQATATGETL